MRRRAALPILILLIILTLMCAVSAAASRKTVPAESISISGSREVAAGKSVRLTASVQPAEAGQEVTWKSSDTAVATVSSAGKVTGIAAGTVKITAVSTENSSVRKSMTVTVRKKAVEKIRITAETTELDLGGQKTVALAAKASPSSASQCFSWKSSRPDVATVSQKGVVTAVGAGRTTITVSAADGSRVKRKITVTVKDTLSEQPKYYALLIGNGLGYPEALEHGLASVPNNLKAVKGMLKGLKGDWKITAKSDQSAGGIVRAIRSAFSGAKSNDVCLFFYSGHGVSDDEAPAVYDSWQGGLIGVDLEVVTGARLASALKAACPGKVIVILDSCGSGSMVHESENARHFVEQMNIAFARADRQGTKTGELRDGKFQVLTTCAYRELSENIDVEENIHVSIFCNSLLKGAGCSFPDGRYGGRMPADLDGNGELTLDEIYAWTRKGVLEATDQSQHVQKYGDGSYVFFSR